MSGSESKKGFGKFRPATMLGDGMSKGLNMGKSGLTKGFDSINKGLDAGMDTVNRGIDDVNKGMSVGLDGINKGLSVGIDGLSKGISAIDTISSSISGSMKKSEASSSKVSTKASKAVDNQDIKPVEKRARLTSDSVTFNWENVGSFSLDVESGDIMMAKAQAMKTYLTDFYVSDLYDNTVLIIGTCFFSWFVARLRGGFFALGFVFLCVASVYRAEIRRFVRDTKDDMLRLSISNRLESELETLEWCNNLLSKVWIVYMPLMGDLVKANVNPILAGMTPGNGIESIELTHFHLGSVAPKITSIKSYTKISKNAYEMDWGFAFDPNDTEHMTKSEIRSQIKPKVVIKTAIGVGIISKKWPINVENMGFIGRMKVRLTFTDQFPMIELVRVQFLEPPKIDYALKPVSSENLKIGIDIMKFIPFLKTFINEGINWGIKSYLIDPNYVEVNLVDIMSAASTDINSVLAINLSDVNLKTEGSYYIKIFTEKTGAEKAIKTKNKSGPQLAFNSTYYVLNNSLDQNMIIELHKSSGKLIGTGEFDLSNLYQDDKFQNVSAKLTSGAKILGTVNFDLRYYPELTAQKSDDGNSDVLPSSETGILKFTLNDAKALDLSSSIVGQISPYAEIYINGKLKHRTRTLKRSNEPVFGDAVEELIVSKPDAIVKVVIKDTVTMADDTILGEFEGNLDDIINQIDNSANNIFKLQPKGIITLGANWKPLALTGVASTGSVRDSIGTLKIHIREAINISNSESVSSYTRISVNGKLKNEGGTVTSSKNTIYDEITFLPVSSANQTIDIELLNSKASGKDSILGMVVFKVGDFLKTDNNDNYFYVDGSLKIFEKQLTSVSQKKLPGFLKYSISFIPTIPIYNSHEIEALKKEDEEIAKKLSKEEEEQKILKDDYEKNPSAYEWVSGTDYYSNRNPLKKILPLEKLIKYNSGTLFFKILEGKLSTSPGFIHVLIDDRRFPGLVAGPSNNGTVPMNEADMFVRDLKNSRITIRETKKRYVELESEVVYERSISTLDLLKKAFDNDYLFEIESNSNIKIELSYNPSIVELTGSDLMQDTGKLKLNILNGRNLLSADSNGKSDPFVVLKLNGNTIFKSDKIMKTLNPDWNEETILPVPSLKRSRLSVEVYDFDIAGDDDFIGSGSIDLHKFIENNKCDLQVPLTVTENGNSVDAGVVNLFGVFTSEYIKPGFSKDNGGFADFIIDKNPVKLVGGVAKGAVSGIGFLANGVGKNGGKIFGSLTNRGNNKRHSMLLKNDDASIHSHKSKQTSMFNGNIHRRSMDLESSINNLSTFDEISTINNKRVAGKLFIKELRPSEINKLPPLQLRVALNKGESTAKEFFKTRSHKESNGVYIIQEDTSFKALPEDGLILKVISHRKFSKDQHLGETEIGLLNHVDNSNDFTVDIDGIGSIKLNINYSSD